MIDWIDIKEKLPDISCNVIVKIEFIESPDYEDKFGCDKFDILYFNILNENFIKYKIIFDKLNDFILWKKDRECFFKITHWAYINEPKA
jgi:hypothetical protein